MKSQPNPIVSVLIPAYNASATLAETLQSVQNQTYKDLEIVVVDDGSTDETFAIASEIAKTDSRILVLGQMNSGVAAARNAALAVGTGEFVAPLDADDLWHPDKIARQLQRASEASGPAIVYCWSAEIDQKSRLIEKRSDLERFQGNIYGPLIISNFIGNASVPLIPRDLLQAVGGWNCDLRAQNAQGCEDWQLYLRLAERAAYLLEPAYLVGYRQAPTAMSRQLRQMRRSYHLVMAEVRQRMPGVPRRLLRWSAAEFAFYEADLLLERGARFSALHKIISGTYLDPLAIALFSYRRRLKRCVRPVPPQPACAPPPQPFGQIGADADGTRTDGRLRARRRRMLSELQLKLR
jgi:glycosyltransferase involved in cell wall biosynthesis